MKRTSNIFLAGCIGILVAAQALAAPPAGPQVDPPADDVHRAADGTPTMPCWRRILRGSLRSDAAALPVVKRLVDYIDSIQETDETEPPVLVASRGN